MELQALLEHILAFRDERDGEQFHTLRNLAAALAIEAAELQEAMLWKTDSEVAEFATSKSGHASLSDEVADIMIFTLLFAHATGIDPARAIEIKLKKNAEKYPVEKAKGSAKKYSDL